MNIEIIQELDNDGPFLKKKVIIDGINISSIVSSIQINMSGDDPTFAKIAISNFADYLIRIKADDIYIESIPLPKGFKQRLYDRLKEEFERTDKDGENKTNP